MPTVFCAASVAARAALSRSPVLSSVVTNGWRASIRVRSPGRAGVYLAKDAREECRARAKTAVDVGAGDAGESARRALHRALRKMLGSRWGETWSVGPREETWRAGQLRGGAQCRAWGRCPVESGDGRT